MSAVSSAFPAASSRPRSAVGSIGYFTNLTRDHGFEPLRVEGDLPPELRGTLVRNGPGLFEHFGRTYDHPFEGDGAICAVRFNGSEAMGAHKVIESEGLREERKVGQPLYGSAAPWARRLVNRLRGRTKNNANTHIIEWQGRLLALMEAGLPTELDPMTLETLGETDLGGAIPSTFSAHPHTVVQRQAIYNFGLHYGRRPSLDLFELPSTGRTRRLGNISLERPVMLHDFIATEKHLVFLVSPVVLQMGRALLGYGYSDLFRWSPELGTEVIIVPIDAPQQIVRFEVEAFFQWHFANAFERGSEIVVDLVRRVDFSSFDGLAANTPTSGGRLHRLVISPQNKCLKGENLWDRKVEFPRIDPRCEGAAHRWVWMRSDRMDGNAIVSMDLSSGRAREYSLPEWHSPSEPIFVPRAAFGAEGDGWVLSLIYDGRLHASHLAVFDALRLEDGPVARAHFDHHVPMTFHGSWLPAER